MASHTTHRGIIVGVDGSPSAKAAVDWAARDAAMRDLPLGIVYAAPSPIVAVDTSMPRDVNQRVEEHGQAVLRDARGIAERATEGSTAVRVSCETVGTAVLPTLIDRSRDADMIVVGCRGMGAIDRLLLGSVSRGLVQHAHCPVAVIHHGYSPAPEASTAPVVVGIDGSPACEPAMEIAFAEASGRGVDLVAVHAWSDVWASDWPSLGWAELRQDAEGMLAERLAGWQVRYPDVNVRRVVVVDQPAHQLVEQSSSAQLTVVGSRGRGGFTGLLLGSVSSAVAQGARTPVIVARQA
jgi:nucleotide-binding universal stress UspA family protein